MTQHRQQAHIEAPLERVWELLGDPRRHPDWWPRVIEVSGERFQEGEPYAQVTRNAFGTELKTWMALDRLDDLREIAMTCQTTGTYSRWVLTEAQGGTFIEAELGMQPGYGIGYRVFDLAAGRLYFPKWLAQSLEGLRTAATRVDEAA